MQPTTNCVRPATQDTIQLMHRGPLRAVSVSWVCILDLVRQRAVSVILEHLLPTQLPLNAQLAKQDHLQVEQVHLYAIRAQLARTLQTVRAAYARLGHSLL